MQIVVAGLDACNDDDGSELVPSSTRQVVWVSILAGDFGRNLVRIDQPKYRGSNDYCCGFTRKDADPHRFSGKNVRVRNDAVFI